MQALWLVLRGHAAEHRQALHYAATAAVLREPPACSLAAAADAAQQVGSRPDAGRYPSWLCRLQQSQDLAWCVAHDRFLITKSQNCQCLLTQDPFTLHWTCHALCLCGTFGPACEGCAQGPFWGDPSPRRPALKQPGCSSGM